MLTAASNDRGLRIAPWDGFPTSDELTARYAAQTGRDICAVRWYSVFGCYKLALLQEGTHARAHAGQAPVETGKALHDRAVALLERAAQWIADPGRT